MKMGIQFLVPLAVAAIAAASRADETQGLPDYWK
jgi:hypothetical protein